MKGKLYKLLDSKIQCLACNRKCIIPENSTGFCKARKNVNNELILQFTNPSSVAIDPIEKKPLYHFLPASKSLSIGTIGCNFTCKFCQNYQISQLPKDYPQHCKSIYDQFEEFTPQSAVDIALKEKCPSISYTYNEPTIFAEYAHSIGTLARTNRIKNVFVTNGYQTNECWDYLSEFVDAANIDLKGDESFYADTCGNVSLRKVLDSISYAKSKGIWVEITSLIIPGLNDNIEFIDYVQSFICSIDKSMPWHITGYYPCYKMNNMPTNAKTLEKLRSHCTKLDYVYCGNIRSVHQNTICPKCKETLIKRNAFTVESNSIINGACPKCGTQISGIFK